MTPEHGGIDPHQHRQLYLALVVLCGLFLAVGVLFGSTTPVGQPMALGDLSQAHMVEVRDAAGHTALSGEFRTRTNHRGDTEADAALTDRSGSRVIGEVELEVSQGNALNRRQELEIDIIELAPRATFTIVIDDRPVATFTTDDRGSIDVEIESPPPGQARQ